MEKWDILNAKGQPTGKIAVRGSSILKPGEYHLVVHIWIISSSGRMLIQRRSDEKKLMPGEWAATGGAAISGETSFLAAKRELFEELGISSDREILTKLLRIKRKNSFVDVWVMTADLDTEELTLQKSEVAEVKWVTLSELDEMIEDGRFHNYGDEYFDTLRERIEDYRGAFV